jgi:integrase
MSSIIEKFLDDKLITASNTRKNYRINIQLYFKQLHGGFPDEGKWRKLSDEQKAVYQQKLEQYINDYFANNGKDAEKYETDLRSTYMRLERSGRPLLAIRTYLNSVKQFMIWKDKSFRDFEFWETLKQRTRNSEPATTDEILNKEKIAQILEHSNVMSKAMFLMLASSGRRIDEILALYPEDVDTTVSPATLNISKGYDYAKVNKVKMNTKSKSKTLCYISDEAAHAYDTWMGQRDAYLVTAVKKATTKKTNVKRITTKDKNDKRVFPMSYQNALTIWQNLVAKSEYNQRDKITDRHITHVHSLRTFFRSYFGNSDFAEHLMGHSSALLRAYRSKTQEDLAALYKQNMANVTIFNNTPVSEVNKQLEQKEEEIKLLKEQMKQQYQKDKDKMKEELLAELIEALGPQHEKVQDFCYNETEQ